MTLLLILVAGISLFGISPRKKPYDESYLDKAQTTMINGIFVMLVFMRHFGEYLTLSGVDRIFRFADSALGQMIVTTFLFYSGFGVMKSIQKKPEYEKKLKKRAFHVWFQYALAVSLYLILSLVLKSGYSLRKILLSYIGLASLGNSNWYIFAILTMYLASYTACKGTEKMAGRTRERTIVFLVFLLSVVYCLLFIARGREGTWYNTICCYPFGMLFALCSEGITEKIKNNRLYLSGLLLSGIGFVLCYGLVFKKSWETVGILAPLWLLGTECKAILFVLFVVLLTARLSIGNKALSWLGKYTFEIYILQRLPMIVLQRLHLNTYLFLAGSIIATLLIAPAFHKVTKF